MATDAANAAAERTISDMVRRAFRASLRAGKRRSTQENHMRSRHAFDAAALLQKDSEEKYYDKPSPSAYGDPEADPRKAADHLQKAMNHIDAAEAGSSDLSTSRLRKYLEDALEALHANDEADEADEEGRDDVMGGRETGGELLDGRGDRARRRSARDGVGEVPPRSVVTNDRARRAHDAAPFDAAALFQRTP
ncbi:MAG: hypothetical protein ACYCT1_05060 [Steroidobacteraceae bacterium]